MVYFNDKTHMVISSATNEVSEIRIDQDETDTVEKQSTSIPVKFWSPLTPIDEVDLSTPQESPC